MKVKDFILCLKEMDQEEEIAVDTEGFNYDKLQLHSNQGVVWITDMPPIKVRKFYEEI